MFLHYGYIVDNFTDFNLIGLRLVNPITFETKEIGIQEALEIVKYDKDTIISSFVGFILKSNFDGLGLINKLFLKMYKKPDLSKGFSQGELVLRNGNLDVSKIEISMHVYDSELNLYLSNGFLDSLWYLSFCIELYICKDFMVYSLFDITTKKFRLVERINKIYLDTCEHCSFLDGDVFTAGSLASIDDLDKFELFNTIIDDNRLMKFSNISYGIELDNYRDTYIVTKMCKCLLFNGDKTVTNHSNITFVLSENIEIVSNSLFNSSKHIIYLSKNTDKKVIFNMLNSIYSLVIFELDKQLSKMTTFSTRDYLSYMEELFKKGKISIGEYTKAMKAGEEVKRIREDITRIRGMYNKIAIKDLKASISESPDIEDSVNLEDIVYVYNNLQTANVKLSGQINLY
jgi:hypothetical protein